MELILASGNKGKAREIEDILGFKTTRIDIRYSGNTIYEGNRSS